MKIVHVTDYTMPPLGYQEVSLARSQAQAGHDVCIVTSDRYRPFEDYDESVAPLLGPRILGPGVAEESGALVRRLPVRWEYWFRVWLAGLEPTLEALAPDVVMVHGVQTFNATRVARLKRRLPPERRFRLIIDEHMLAGVEGHHLARAYHYVFRQTAARYVRSAADAFVGVGPAYKDFMVQRYGLPADDVAVVPLGADTTIFYPDDERRAAMRLALGVPPEAVAAVYGGKLVSEKAPHLLVDAATRVMQRNPSLWLIMVGSGLDAYVGSMQAQARERGVADRCRWTGAVPNDALPDYYRAADFGVWPRMASLTMVEAQATGLPIVVSDFPAAAERVARGGGLAVPYGDVGALADAVAKLAKDADLRTRLAREGLDLVRSELDYGRLSEQILALVS